jgi:hypothetical protein
VVVISNSGKSKMLAENTSLMRDERAEADVETRLFPARNDL